MTAQQTQLNHFLVHVFNDILRLEETSLQSTSKNLSLRELHMLEALQNESAYGDVSMAQLARTLNVTAGTLTIGMKTLEQKGFVTRLRSSQDKRRVHVALTERALPVLAAHTAFHTELVTKASAHLSDQQIETLCAALQELHNHFNAM